MFSGTVLTIGLKKPLFLAISLTTFTFD